MNAFNFPVEAIASPLRSDAGGRAFDLRELRYFHSVARTGNFGRSARELNVSQPAISQQMRKLEEGLGTQLLVRHGRGVMLTLAGVCLRDRLDIILQLLSAPLDGGASAVGGPAPFALAVPAESSALLAPPLARAFREQWPGATLDLREGSGADIEEWVLHHRVGLAVLRDPPNLDAFCITPILTERLGVVASARSRLADAARPVRLRDLADDALILPDERSWIRRRVETTSLQHGLRLRPVLQGNSVVSIKAMVRNGLGCAVLPLSAVQDEVAHGSLVFRPISQPDLVSVCALVRRQPAPADITTFADTARGVLTALAESGEWPGATVVPQATAHAAADLDRMKSAPADFATRQSERRDEPVEAM